MSEKCTLIRCSFADGSPLEADQSNPSSDESLQKERDLREMQGFTLNRALKLEVLLGKGPTLPTMCHLYVGLLRHPYFFSN